MATYDLHDLSPAIREALWQLVQACQPAAGALTPRCPHGTTAQPCCVNCAVLSSAESILCAVQPTEVIRGEMTFPRGPIEQAVLEVLQSVAPLPCTTLQVSALLGIATHQEVQTVLKALALLGTIEHPRRGYYRYRPR